MFKHNSVASRLKNDDPFFDLLGDKLFQMVELILNTDKEAVFHSSIKVVGSIGDGTIKVIATPRSLEPSKSYHFSAADITQSALQEILIQFVVDSLS